MDVKIRNMQDIDYEDVDEIMLQIQQMHSEGRSDVFSNVNTVLSKEEFEKKLHSNRTVAIVAEIAGKVVGISLSIIKPKSYNLTNIPTKAVFVDYFGVDEKYQGNGIGKLLFNETVIKAKKSNVDSFELMVWSFNENAIQFYKAMGMTHRSCIMELKV